MKPFIRIAATAALAVALGVAFAAPAVADHPAAGHVGDTASYENIGHAVFVQTDGLSGNRIVSYDRAPDGSLTFAGSYATGGVGGQLDGSVVDHIASQGSLTYDADHSLLFAVNAGSDNVSVFGVRGDHLDRLQVIPSGGRFPVSIAVHDGLVFVLNAEAGGSIQGYGVFFGRLFPLPGTHRALGLDPTATPQFVNTPGQVAFSPDGRQLIVTTKANGNDIDVFRVGFFGTLSASPVVNAEPGTVPFAVTFDAAGNLVVAEAGTNALATFALHHDGTVVPLSSAGTGQSATCWITAIDGRFYASNAGSGSVSRFTEGAGGTLTLVDNTGTDAGTVDSAAAPDGHFLYVQTGANGVVDEYHVNGNGSLTQIGSVTVPAAVGGEGIVAI